MTFYRSTPAVIFWQLANQSFNSLVNYTNRNASATPCISKRVFSSDMNPLSLIQSELGGAATALSLLASLASSQHRNNVDSGLMPVYGELPATSVVSLKALAAFSEGVEYEGEGPLRLSFNSSMREWQEMGKKSFFLLRWERSLSSYYLPYRQGKESDSR